MTPIRANATQAARRPASAFAGRHSRPEAAKGNSGLSLGGAASARPDPGAAIEAEVGADPKASVDGGLPPRATGTTMSDGTGLLADQLESLPALGLPELRLEWRRLFRAEPPRIGRDTMMRAIAYRWQEAALGGLSKATLRRLTTLANQLETNGRIAPLPGPRIKPGARLIREWGGRTHAVNVTDDGFEFQGETFGSLTRIAFAITGAHWSGPRFFGLTKPAPAPPSASAAESVSCKDDAQTVEERADG